MLQASSERPAVGAAAASLWVPGMSPQAVDSGSARAQEIARGREELLGMLRDLPESEYELSLTDLVEKAGAGGNGNGSVAQPPSEGKETSPIPVGTGRSASGRQAEQQPAAAGRPERRNGSVAQPPSEGKETSPIPVGTGRSASGRQAEQQPAAAGRPERRGSARRWDSGSSFRSSSDGVLLNFYMPRSLTRSFTTPRPGRTPSVSGGRTASVSSDCSKRERDGDTVRCWSLLWDRRWRKSSRRDPHAPPNESTIRAASAAILKAANHSDPPAKI